MVCAAQFFGSAQHALLQPTFPLYITHLGDTPFQVGLVLACFAVTSVVFRPLIGGWADQWSEAGVSCCGLALLSVAVLICFMPHAEAILFANALRGLGWAAMSAAGYSLLALSAPPHGATKPPVITAACKPAALFAAAVALWLIDAPFGGFPVVFTVAVALAAIGACISAALMCQLPKKIANPHGVVIGSWWQKS
jgi:MFS family permease